MDLQWWTILILVATGGGVVFLAVEGVLPREIAAAVVTVIGGRLLVKNKTGDPATMVGGKLILVDAEKFVVALAQAFEATPPGGNAAALVEQALTASASSSAGPAESAGLVQRSEGDSA